MKKLVSVLLALVMVCSLSVFAFAAGSEDTPKNLGTVTVKVSKEWKGDEGALCARPESVTVKIGEEGVVLTADEGWSKSIAVDAFDDKGATKVYAVSEDKVEHYTTEICPEMLEMKGFVPLTNMLDKVPDCRDTKKYLDGWNTAIFKKGSDYLIWTAQELTAGAKKALTSAIECSGYSDLADLADPEFVFGYGTFQLWDQKHMEKLFLTIAQDGTITFDAKCTWSWFYRGNVKLEQSEYDVTVTNTYASPAIYEWVQTGEDSATGYDPCGRIARAPWFMCNTVDVCKMDAGESVTFDIQAGEYKNGTNFVGSYTVTKVADGKFRITYNVNSLDETHKIELNGAKLWINGTGKFLTSPGNQKGNAVRVNAGQDFDFAGDTLYVFAHFNATYWEWMEVLPE